MCKSVLIDDNSKKKTIKFRKRNEKKSFSAKNRKEISQNVVIYAKFDKGCKEVIINSIRIPQLTNTYKHLQTHLQTQSEMLFTEEEYRELEYEALTAQMARHMISESGDVQEKLCQEHAKIANAYNAISGHQESMKFSDEWGNMEGDINFGDHETFTTQEYLHMWDIQEMYYDMNAFESDMNTQIYLANAPEGTTTCDTIMEVTTRGPNYSTGDTIYGKVYIPKHLGNEIQRRFGRNTPLCKITYNGCETSRESENIRMPWKLTEIL